MVHSDTSDGPSKKIQHWCTLIFLMAQPVTPDGPYEESRWSTLRFPMADNPKSFRLLMAHHKTLHAPASDSHQAVSTNQLWSGVCLRDSV